MISIITSLYQSEEHLLGFLRSLEKVSRKLTGLGITHECIILPNDPSAKELLLINRAVDKNQNIKMFPRTRESLYATWNAGIARSSYKLITFWNVDDIRFANAIEIAVKTIDSSQATIAYFPFIYNRYVKILTVDILVKIKIIKAIEFNRDRFAREMPIGPFFIATKKAFEMNGIFDGTFRIVGDYEWSTRAVRNKLQFKKINIIAGVFKNNGKTLSGSKDSLQSQENQRVLNAVK